MRKINTVTVTSEAGFIDATVIMQFINQSDPYAKNADVPTKCRQNVILGNIKMRLTEQEKSAIRETIHHEDPTADIFLFGSRVDDKRKGGDIDLYVETRLHEKLLKHKARILARLWERIGVQRIDIILKPRNCPMRAIHREAKTSGIRL